MKSRIAAAVAVGIVLIGLWAWPLASSSEPFGAVLASSISFGGKIALVCLAFFAGLLAYFVSWPYGREIGVLAVPSGLALWAVRSGSMADLMRTSPTLTQRQGLLEALKWEPVFWLVIVAAGFAGVLLGQKIRSKPHPRESGEKEAGSKASIFLNAAVALIGSGLLAQLCIGLFARDVRVFDSKLGSVLAQPPVGQIVFAVLVSFGLAAFLVKKFLNVSYIWPSIASAIVTGFVIATYVKQGTLQHLVEQWPAAFFPHAVVSILPVQIVAFGTLGSIIGYWLAVRYNYWRKHG
jgi:hypothetical protein